MTNAKERELAAEMQAAMEHHPLWQDEIILTQPLETLTHQFRLCVVGRTLGSYVAAPAGAGKSYAARHLQRDITQRFTGAPVLLLSKNNNQVTSVAGFFSEWQRTIGTDDVSGTGHELRARTERALLSIVQQSRKNYCVLIIDEAHQMEEDDFRYLKDIYNSLAATHCRLLTCLIGQSPELDIKLKTLQIGQQQDLIDRFATLRLSFRGLESIGELKKILKTIDSSVYREKTWTEFFLPSAFQSGYRLENDVEEIYSILRNNESSNKDGGYSLRRLFTLIRALLYSACFHDCSGFTMPDEVWEIVRWQTGADKDAGT